jgi:hypothetical protein
MFDFKRGKKKKVCFRSNDVLWKFDKVHGNFIWNGSAHGTCAVNHVAQFQILWEHHIILAIITDCFIKTLPNRGHFHA